MAERHENFDPDKLAELERERKRVEMQEGADELGQALEGQAKLRETHKPSLDNWPAIKPNAILAGAPLEAHSGDTGTIRDRKDLEDILTRGVEGTGSADAFNLTENIGELMDEELGREKSA